MEARDENGFRWAGTVDATAADLGVLWIRNDFGERKVLDVYDFEITSC